jgi:anaerobic selenocysteine-containing dehydrogenase
MSWSTGVCRGAHIGFDALKTIVREYTPRMVAELCGIAEADLAAAARWFAAGPTLSLYCQGLNQSSAGTAKNAALINLHLATGQIGKPGAGPFSLTGQPNAWAAVKWAAWPICCRRIATFMTRRTVRKLPHSGK